VGRGNWWSRCRAGITERRWNKYGIIGFTMWRRLLAGIIGIVGLLVWKRFLGEGSKVQSTGLDNPAEALHETWVKSGSMSGREFERFVAELLRAAGYKVDVVGEAGDQGVDLLVKKGCKLIAVQCKKYGRPVGNAAVSAVYAGAKHYGAKQAWVVAPEGFTKGAIELAKSTGVRLMGRKGIDGLLQDE
jgi:HJR/Mrr/RecB family endonuclease